MHLFTLESAIFADGLCIASVLAFIIVLVFILIFEPIRGTVSANAFIHISSLPCFCMFYDHWH
jgi:hypothetical protein